jgi:radical SAM protein with 4Fe4S-binding SPASM domain
VPLGLSFRLSLGLSLGLPLGLRQRGIALMGIAAALRRVIRPKPAPEPAVIYDLSWVDEFISRVRPYVFVRREDKLLIKRPNQAQKLNPQGAALLESLLEGVSISRALDGIGRAPDRIRDVALFLIEVRRFLEGTLDESNASTAVEVEPFDMRFSKLPILSEVAVTYRCNLRCSFCYAGCNCTTNPAGDDREMSTEEVAEVLRKIFREGKVPSVSFTGGEPTLRRDLPELVRHASGLGMRVNLITNGTLMSEGLARVLADAGLDSAQVSLEGVSAETHDGVTSIRGSFERSLAAVEHLDQAGVLVHTNTTINRDNLRECLEMPRFVRQRLGRERFSMNLLVPTGSAVHNDGLAVSYSEIGPHLEDICAESRRLGVEFMWYSPVPMCMFNSVAHGLGNKGCSACDGLLSVAANGDVLPCASFDESVGNLLREGVDDVWRSDRAALHRDKFLAHPECRSCPEFEICQGACPLYWRELGFGELQRLQGFAPVDMERFA